MIDFPDSTRFAMFPMLKTETYLDTGTAGLSTSVHAAAASLFYSEGKWQGALGRECWQDTAQRLKEKLAIWLSVSPSEIDFFSGTSDSLNRVAQAIQWSEGDEIVFASDEFPSVRVAWQTAADRGAVLRSVDVPSEDTREDTIIAALTDRTRVLTVAHVHSIAGTCLNLERIGKACRDNGTLFVVDGIHGMGAVTPQLRYVDAYMAGTFKWMLAGFGISVCFVRQSLRDQMSPSFRGYLNEAPSDALQFAHINYPGAYTLEASFDLFNDTLGWDLVQGRMHDIVAHLDECLSVIGLTVVSPKRSRAGLASFEVPDAEALRLSLFEQNIHVAARGKYLRATPYFYNSEEDVEKLADHVGRLLKRTAPSYTPELVENQT